ncbi:hypothetical protein OIU34_19905 [Pararhizobium sp. BT-229]|uniref:hypothetical protein n=1 Tax=Pararhizobium sp. BT-229 TaxID=2986923 RepID=UPI0021F7EF03|nr:hypothetical protein [Pararhizobium sp. BT-229]MCV9964151.1 hypothetical protein [Pararhizobium sp. BT-229]
MKVTIEVPLFGEASSARMFGSRFLIASERREYDIPEFDSFNGSKVLSVRPGKHDHAVDFHLVDGQSHRDTGVDVAGDAVFKLQVGRDTMTVHPFFDRAFRAMSPKIGELSKLIKAELKDQATPSEFVEALYAGGSAVYTPLDLASSRFEWWTNKEVEGQIEAFDAWMERFVSVGGRLMVREAVPMLMVAGEPDFPVFEVVWGGDIRDPVSMNTSIGFMPKTFGYFGMEEFDTALDFAAKVGGGWLSDPDICVDMVSPLIPTRPYADLSLLDVVEGMRKRFVRRIASVSHDPDESFAEMEDALATISVTTFALFKELVEGIAEWNESQSSARVLGVVPAILADENARKVFFVTERLAMIADLVLERWDARPMDITTLAA